MPDPLMYYAVLLHRAHEHRLRVALEQAGERTWFLAVTTTRAMRRLRYRTVHRETRIDRVDAHTLAAAARRLDADLVADPPRHRFERGHE